jgi:hypothetical protein
MIPACRGYSYLWYGSAAMSVAATLRSRQICDRLLSSAAIKTQDLFAEILASRSCGDMFLNLFVKESEKKYIHLLGFSDEVHLEKKFLHFEQWKVRERVNLNS